MKNPVGEFPMIFQTNQCRLLETQAVDGVWYANLDPTSHMCLHSYMMRIEKKNG
jgi:hypothetical protein